MRPAMRLLVWLLLVPASITAQEFTFYGRYFVTSTASMGAEGTCQFSGEGDITQAGDQLGGMIRQTLVSGPILCPPVMQANLLVTTTGSTVTGTLDGGVLLGTASISGTVTPDGFAGSYATSPNGPFGELEGTWSATRSPESPVPTLGIWGVVLLAAVLLLAGFVLLRGRRRSASH